jgi:PTS system ascorbate-specific IIB component
MLVILLLITVASEKQRRRQMDIVFASKYLIQELEGRTTSKLLGLDNLMDDAEIKENLQQVI